MKKCLKKHVGLFTFLTLSRDFRFQPPLVSGVPQGTVMGPLLFLLHINDLPENVTSKVRLFADDCLLYRPIHNANDQLALQRDLDPLVEWSDKWGLEFSTKKCGFIRMCLK